MPAAAAGLPVRDRADEQPVAGRQADGAPQATRDARRRDRDAEARGPRGAAAPESLRALGEALGGGNRDDQAAVEPHRVEPQQAPVQVDERPAAGPAREGSGVLDAAGDRATPRPAYLPPLGRDEPGRRAQSAPAGIAERDHGRADAGSRARGVPRDRLDLTGLDRNGGEVEVVVDPRRRDRSRAVHRER